MKRASSRWVLACVLLASVWVHGPTAKAETVRVAVAANFARTLEKLARSFESLSGHAIVPSAASTGQLYAQIRKGAPYDVFLAADQERPTQLEKAGLTVPDSRIVYARGKLVLWSRRPGAVKAGGEVLASPDLRTVALADPRAAPYGRAARRYLEQRGLWSRLESGGHIALSTSVAHAYQFVATGAAEVGFLALSQILNGEMAGSHWVVPTAEGALDQAAVLLKRAHASVAARAWMRYLTRHPTARRLIVEDGYGVP